MSTYYVGWDVGALYCKKRKLKKGNYSSHDALCILDENGAIISTYDEPISVNTMLEKKSVIAFICNFIIGKSDNFKPRENDKFIIAIDGVFRWPSVLADIYKEELDIKLDIIATVNDAIKNRYLYRLTEMFVKEKIDERNRKIKKGCQTNNPFSVVQNSIGSQSIKVMCFLQIFGFKQRQRIGVWEDDNGNLAIETYPSVVNEKKGDTDCQDAYICASLAKMFSEQEMELFAPPQNLNPEILKTEGWIWFPKEPVKLDLNKI